MVLINESFVLQSDWTIYLLICSKVFQLIFKNFAISKRTVGDWFELKISLYFECQVYNYLICAL